ncbi:hypothetical protein J6590_058262 [Homalodisca vitripennis]|nr:hypothetical protein J6590_058262 [Homalodisca vitripennis]
MCWYSWLACQTRTAQFDYRRDNVRVSIRTVILGSAKLKNAKSDESLLPVYFMIYDNTYPAIAERPSASPASYKEISDPVKKIQLVTGISEEN